MARKPIHNPGAAPRKRRLGTTDMEITTLGFGAWAIGGGGWAYGWGPQDDSRSIAAIWHAVGRGVNWIDTAAIYGLGHSEEVVGRALREMPAAERPFVFTKGGMIPNRERPYDEPVRDLSPTSIRQEVIASLRRLGVERIDLFQLHRIDPTVPADEQFGLLAALQSEGKIASVGLSEVGVADVERASAIVDIATVQNRYNLIDRASDDVLRHCTEQGIGFIPWAPIASGRLAEPGGPVAEAAEQLGVSAPEVVLAWLLQRSSVMLPIPGTKTLAHLEENMGAAKLQLDLELVEKLDAAA